MIRINAYKISFLRLLSIIVLADLIFGGSGRLIMIGNISFRTVLFGVVMIYTLITMISRPIKLDVKLILLIFCFIVYISINVLTVGDKEFTAKFDFLSRYLYVLMVFFYNIYFYRYYDTTEIERIRVYFETFTFIFAVFSVLLWLYAFRLGGNAYSVIEYGFFRPKVYGNFAFLAGGIPRIFMKSSIFIPIGLLFQLDSLIDKPTTLKIIKLTIYIIAIITTFTTGFFVATSICVVVLMHKRRVMNKQIGILFVILIILGAFLISRLGVVDMMVERFSGPDYTSTYRLTQLSSIIKEFIQKPLFGHGFAYEYTTVYGNTVRTTSGFEVAWGELLVDTGVIGFILFVLIYSRVFRQLSKLSKQNKTVYVFLVGLALICLESFTNPFINNAIGLTYFGICAGITNVIYRDHSFVVTKV